MTKCGMDPAVPGGDYTTEMVYVPKKEYDRLIAHAEELREALEEIESFDTCRYFEGSPTHIDPEVKIVVGPCAKIAQKALALCGERK